MLGLLPMATLAETNALIEVKLFKDWVLQGESSFGSMAIQNTGTVPIPLEIGWGGQFFPRLLSDKSNAERNADREETYQLLTERGVKFFELPPGETHVYEGWKFYFPDSFASEEFMLSVYLGKGFWLDSEPLTVNKVTPDLVEPLAAIDDWTITNMVHIIEAITYKNERWLYTKRLPNPQRGWKGGYGPVCPLSLTNKINVEPHNQGFVKILDGDKSMIYDLRGVKLVEAPDETNVLIKWTRERKQQAEADNAEVRKKKAEVP